MKKHINFDDYKTALFDNKKFEHKMRTLRSEGHEMFLEEVQKLSLNPFDDKRYIMDDGINTAPYGTYYEKYIDYNPRKKLGDFNEEATSDPKVVTSMNYQQVIQS